MYAAWGMFWKVKMLRKLRNRMLLICLAMTTMVMAAAFSTIFLDTYRTVANERELRLDAIERHFDSAASLMPGAVITGMRFLNPNVNLAQSFLMLASGDGELTYLYTYIHIHETTYAEVFQTVWARGNTRGFIEIDNRLWMYRISHTENFVWGMDGLIIVLGRAGDYTISFIDVSESNEMLRNLLLTFIMVGLVTLTFIFFLSLYVANRSIKPVDESLRRQKQFVSNASHELKTPLAIIAANMEALLINGEDTIKNQSKWIGYIQKEVMGMEKLIGDMLYLAKSEESSKRTLVDFGSVVEHTAAAMEALLFERNISLKLDVSPGIKIMGDAQKLTQLVRILMDNAAKYTESGGVVTVKLSRGKNTCLTVINTGTGISPKDLHHIFERFYRASDKANGTGLGLAIAKAIVESMNGTITAASDGGMVTFEVRL